ncbi:uncharacterized protein LOC122871514 [Siniperca chuatsi]|uniref:uncharacterized protein LOC122871514 n=1 Tax=Siniperca chuatsi TaxID=119488 RepID=UPI001CE0B6BF|nr:uncharacterized protein LOC122871514 [Siniperca chuatsi]
MASAGLRREKYLLTLGIVRVLDERYVVLPRPGPVLQMILTNLRNRPLSSTNMDSMCKSILSLYHSLVTGSKDFPLISFKGFFRSLQTTTPFVRTKQSRRENTTPSPFTGAPAGMIVRTATSSSSPPNMLTPVLPEKTELGALKADRRNSVRNMEFDGSTVTRVISTVYRSESTELTNRWRVTDYGANGHVLMSVLCQFTKKSAQYAVTPRQEKRKDTEEECSSQSPSKKRLRL